MQLATPSLFAAKMRMQRSQTEQVDTLPTAALTMGFFDDDDEELKSEPVKFGNDAVSAFNEPTVSPVQLDLSPMMCHNRSFLKRSRPGLRRSPIDAEFHSPIPRWATPYMPN